MKLDNQESPEWLKKLQLNSWEPEILLSGIVLYGMFKTPELLDSLYAFAQTNLSDNVNDFKNFISLLKVAIYWLIFGLILHLISRGIWVGMVGLSFTFPNGINSTNLKLSPKFKGQIDNIPSIQKIIITLEKICSSLFSISFMLFMCMIGAYFYFFLMLIIPIFSYVYLFMDGSFGNIDNPVMIGYVLVVLGVGFLALVDFITLGWLKRFKWFSKIYYPIYRVISVVTLSRLYRPIYYSIISNLSKWKISIILIMFVLVSFYSLDNVDQDYPGESFSQIELWSDRQGVDAYSGNYDDQNSDKYSSRAHIQSDIIRGNTVRLFVVARADIEENIRESCNYDSLAESLDTARMYLNLHCISSYYKVFIDDSLVQDLPWKFHFKSSTQQRGLLTWINVRSLPEGLHELKLKGSNQKGDRTFSTIPFYREYSEGLYIPEKIKSQDEKEADYMSIKPLLPK